MNNIDYKKLAAKYMNILKPYFSEIQDELIILGYGIGGSITAGTTDAESDLDLIVYFAMKSNYYDTNAIITPGSFAIFDKELNTTVDVVFHNVKAGTLLEELENIPWNAHGYYTCTIPGLNKNMVILDNRLETTIEILSKYKDCLIEIMVNAVADCARKLREENPEIHGSVKKWLAQLIMVADNEKALEQNKTYDSTKNKDIIISLKRKNVLDWTKEERQFVIENIDYLYHKLTPNLIKRAEMRTALHEELTNLWK